MSQNNYMQVMDEGHCTNKGCHKDYKPSELPQGQPCHCWPVNEHSPCTESCGKWWPDYVSREAYDDALMIYHKVKHMASTDSINELARWKKQP